MPLLGGAIAIGTGTVLVLITVVVAPIAAIAFARSGPAWERIGRGPLAIEEAPGAGSSDRAAGGGPVRSEEAPVAETSDRAGEGAQLRAEVGQHVRAANERRARRGEQPLDVE